MAKGSIANFAYSLRDEAELDSQVYIVPAEMQGHP